MPSRITQRIDQVSTGDISAVTTSSTSGFSGGGTSGAIALTVDASRLTALGATIAATDYLIMYDTDGTATKKVLVSNTLAVWG